MLAARPTVATDVGGVSEALGGIRLGEGGTGLLVEPGDPRALANASFRRCCSRQKQSAWASASHCVTGARALRGCRVPVRLLGGLPATGRRLSVSVRRERAMSLPSTLAPDIRALDEVFQRGGAGVNTLGARRRGPAGLHLAATTLLMKCPHPLSAIEVAVVLETCGYSPTRVRATGAADLMELARAVYALVPVYAQGQASAAADGGADGRAATKGTPGWHWRRRGRSAKACFSQHPSWSASRPCSWPACPFGPRSRAAVDRELADHGHVPGADLYGAFHSGLRAQGIFLPWPR